MSISWWMDKLNVMDLHNGIVCCQKKKERNEALIHATTSVNIENIVLCERRQRYQNAKKNELKQ